MLGDEVLELFKGSESLCLIIVSISLIIISPTPIGAVHEFTVFRMQHYDLQGTPYGRKNYIY